MIRALSAMTIAAGLMLVGCSGSSSSPTASPATTTPTATSTTGTTAIPGPSGSTQSSVSGSTTPLASAATAAAGRRCHPTRFRLEPTAKAERQAAALVKRMSLTQEVTLMHGGGFNSGPSGAVGSSAAIPALHVPAVNQEDGPGGIGDLETGVTQLPAPIALAATFDPAAARCYGQVIGTEARAKGIELTYGPTVNLVRVPEWGRAFESLGEDPTLTGSLGAAEVAGTQGAGVMAQVKHFAVYNQETNRNSTADDSIVSKRTEQELYLKAWRAIVGARPASIMCSYSTINGQPACQDRALLRGYLNNGLHFGGFIGADYYATHSTVPSARGGLDQEQPGDTYFSHRLIAAVKAGKVPRALIDQAARRIVTQDYRFRLFTDYPKGNSKINVASARDASVARSIAAQATVLLKNSSAGHAQPTLPLSGSGSIAVIGPAAGASTATGGGGSAAVVPPGTVTPLAGIRAAAPNGTTVSYAQGLPSAAQLTTVPPADLSPSYPAGGDGGAFTATLRAPETGTYIFGLTSSLYFKTVTLSIDGHPLLNDPDSRPLPTYTVATHLLAGHSYRLAISGASSALRWAPPSVVAPEIRNAAQSAAQAKTAVVVVADPQESEATDRVGLSLPSAQDQLVQAVAEANPRTVVVVEAGAAVTMPWLPNVSAVLDQWYPGQTDGGSLADVLFGAVNPSGHLPITFPASVAAVPTSSARQFPGVNGKVHYSEGLNMGYRWWIDTHHAPLFPFGFGLSYTHFHYSTPHVSVVSRRTVRVVFSVANTGSRAGADVAQVYLGSPAAGEPSRALAGFRRLEIAPGHSVRVSITLGPAQLGAFVGGHWQIPAGTYTAYVGDSSARTQLAAPVTFMVAQSTRLPEDLG